MSLAAVIERSKRERENWRYTDLEKILLSFRRTPEFSASDSEHVSHMPRRRAALDTGVRRYDDKGEGSAQLTFIDGVWQPEQSRLGDLPPGIMQGDATKGYRLELAGQTCLVTSPVELQFVATPDAPQETATKLRIELGASGRLTLIERHQGSTAAHIMETEITLHPQAKLVHGKIVNGGEGAHLAMTRAHVAEGAYYDNFALVRGGRLTRNEIEVKLNGKLAQCTLNGAMLLRGREHADTTTRTIHAAPHGSSRQVYKTVLGGASRGVFQGKIIVAEDAQKTDGYQLSRALLLSDQAEMDAKPELEIHADDVKCSHGSAIGDLDPDALFYLRARGLSEEEARGMLIRAFIGEILDEIHVPEWRELCRAEVEGWLDEQN